MNRPLDLIVAADEGIDIALSRFIDEVDGKGFQRFHSPSRLALFIILIFLGRCFTLFFAWRFWTRRGTHN